MKYHVISPDGIPTDPEPFAALAEAEAGLAAFVRRFEGQGFYRCADGVAIPFAGIAECCHVERVFDYEGWRSDVINR